VIKSHFTMADLRTVAAAAIHAPSLHNSQPWRFRLHDGTVEVLSDPGRQLSVADRTGWAVRIACGAAVFNARVALAVNGTPAEVQVRLDLNDPMLIARLAPGPPRPATMAEQELFDAIPYRRSYREPFWPTPVPSEVRGRLVEAARAEGVWLELLIGKMPLTVLAEIAQSADRVLRRDLTIEPNCHSGSAPTTRTTAYRWPPAASLPSRRIFYRSGHTRIVAEHSAVTSNRNHSWLSSALPGTAPATRSTPARRCSECC
jgi:hypothetical protein